MSSNNDIGDVWKIDVKSRDKVTVPSFIRLFIIARVLKLVGIDESKIQRLSSEIQDSKQKELARYIITQLQNHGIKKYMQDYFNEKEQIQTIELIFNKIILKHFANEYKNTTTYTPQYKNSQSSSKDYNTYQTLVFNTDDLMHLIFQFCALTRNFTGDLINCGLVNSHWLFQSFNPNSIYSFHLYLLLRNTFTQYKKTDTDTDKKKNCDNIGNTSKWQRIVNVKSIAGYMSNKAQMDVDKFNKKIVEKLSMMKNIVRINLEVGKSHAQLIQILMSNNKDNIKECNVVVTMSGKLEDTNILSPLKLQLMNVEKISIHDMYFYYHWSNKCTKLRLYLKNIDYNWCKYIIDNCDCSNVKDLLISHVTFFCNKSIAINLENDDNYNYNYNYKCDNDELKFKSKTKLLLQQFSNKFSNLKILDIVGYKYNRWPDMDSAWLVLLFKYLSSIIKKNETEIMLFIDPNDPNFNQLIKTIEKEKIYMHIKCFKIYTQTNSNIDYCKYIVFNNPNLKYFSLLVNDINSLHQLSLQLTKFEQENFNENENDSCTARPLSSLQVLKMAGPPGAYVNINTINNLVKLKLVESNRLFIYAHFMPNKTTSDCTPNDFVKIFESICQRLYLIIIEKRIPIDISLGISNKPVQERCCSIFNKYFSQEILERYQPPFASGNQHFKPMVKPNVSFKSGLYCNLTAKNAIYFEKESK